jgi:putative transposase
VKTAYRCRAYPGPMQASVLQQAIRHQQAACTAFFAQRARYPGFVLEDLAVQNMVRNRRLAKAIADCGWGTFRAKLGYKAVRYGRRVMVIDRWYPSSKGCSACGYVLAELSLGTRTWPCPSCGTRHDRDVNAATNILAAGRAVAGDNNPGHACGADVSHAGSSRVRSA